MESTYALEGSDPVCLGRCMIKIVVVWEVFVRMFTRSGAQHPRKESGSDQRSKRIVPAPSSLFLLLLRSPLGRRRFLRRRRPPLASCLRTTLFTTPTLISIFSFTENKLPDWQLDPVLLTNRTYISISLLQTNPYHPHYPLYLYISRL